MNKCNMRKIACFIIFIILLLSFKEICVAQDSFSLDTELKPVLSQQPILYDFLFTNLDIDKTGLRGGARTTWEFKKKFGQTSIGPYYIKAKPKGSKGDYTFMLTVYIRLVYIDKEGNRTNFEKAESIKEEFEKIEVTLIEQKTAEE